MINTSVVSSTFLLTLLLMLGLFFFIRASVKDRTQKIKLIADQTQEALLTNLQKYFEGRSYQIIKLDRSNKQVTYEGFVSPSWFLAIFLSLLAGFGLLCLAVVLLYLFPRGGKIFLLLVALAPLSGYFYWQKAGRLEKIDLKVEAIETATTPQTLMTIAAHRDELIQLQQNFSSFERVD